MQNINFEEIPTGWYMNGRGKVFRIPREFRFISKYQPHATYKAINKENTDGYIVNYSGVEVTHTLEKVRDMLEAGTWRMLSETLPIDHTHDISKAMGLPPDEDIINNPSHYHKNGIDVIQFAKMQFPKEEVKGFLKINILKYATRYDRKGGVEDLKKLAKYTDLLIELEEEDE